MHVGLEIYSLLYPDSILQVKGFMYLLLHVLVLANSTNNILTTYLLLTKFLWMHHCTCAMLVRYPLPALSSVLIMAMGYLECFLSTDNCVKSICHV